MGRTTTAHRRPEKLAGSAFAFLPPGTKIVGLIWPSVILLGVPGEVNSSAMRVPVDSPPEPSFRKRKLAAILHADVVGFSRLMGEDEAGTHRALGELRRAVDPLIMPRGGRIVGTAGDSLLADFSSVVDAVSCAVEIQLASRAINDPMPPDRRLELRIGVSLGDVIVDGCDIF